MTPAQSIRNIVSGMALLGVAMGSAALSLGRAQGPALVGQPLDLRIQVQFDSGEDLQVTCLIAEVFYGDSQVDPSRVSVALDSTTANPASRSTLVRVRAAAAVNEPVVTVQLRSGCQIRSSKRYTLLADLPIQVVEAPQRTPSRVLAPMEAVDLSRSGGSVTLQKPVPQGDAPAALRSDTPRKAKTAPLVAPSVAAQPPAPARAPKSTKTRARAHLKLDSLDLLMERDPVLRASDELLSAPQEGGSQRAEAAALWRALNATPEQILREEIQAQRAAEELKSLYAITNANQKGLMELVAKVERADSERYANSLVYSLLALCVVGLVALVWVWQRMRRMVPAPDWKQGMDAGDSLMVELMHAHSSREPTTPAAPKPVAAATGLVRAVVPSAPMPLTEVDVDLGQINPSWKKGLFTPYAVDPWATPANAAPSAWRTLEVPTLPTATGGIDFSVSVSPVLRSMDTEELEDIRQQAEFFISLGQQEKAIDILTTRVAQCGESSPLVCLDLLKLYHALGRETEYDFMRTEFHHWFTGRVPEFAEFANEGRALDRYLQVMERIVNMWPGASVLAYIEDCLYQHTGALSGQVFDLQAYRDLLLLHTVAKRIIRMADDTGAGDAHIPDMVRIPVRGGNPTRPGGQREDDDDEAGLQADNDTNSAPLGPMKVPPTPAVGPTELELLAPVHDKSHTDFNFLNLR